MGRNSRRKKERRRKHAESAAVIASARAKTIDKIEKALGRRPDLIVETPRGRPKISDTLEEFAQPLIELLNGTANVRVFENTLSIAVAVWNAYLLGEEEGEKLLDDLLRRLAPPAEVAALLDGVMDELWERRASEYGDDRRAITSFTVVADPLGGYHLSVASVPDKETTARILKELAEAGGEKKSPAG